ncbi:MAG: GtrA family protein [Micrococcales bacterium]|nr:GtrA family protein [Micrococcales bacterium]
MTAAGRHVSSQAGRFAVVGAFSTVFHLALFAAFEQVMAPQAANLSALVIATVANTALNRRWTFGVQGREGAAKHQLQGLVLFFVTWAATAGGLWAVHALVAHPPTWVQTFAVLSANVIATLIRFVAMRMWMFRGHAPARHVAAD